MNLLEVEGVGFAYGRKPPVISDIGFPPLAGGQLLGLLGPNAAGKSTLMRCIADGRADTGTIRLLGQELAAMPRDERTRLVGYMPQTPPQPSSLTAYELVRSAAELTGMALGRGEIDALLHSLGLAVEAFRPLSALSGGKRQLVGLALALLRRPRLLLLDEPTSALDLYWRNIVLAQVRRHLAEAAAGAIVAFHDLDLAARYCDRLVLLDHGRVVAGGSPAEVLTPGNLARVYNVEAEILSGADGRIIVNTLRPLVAHPTHGESRC